MAYRILTETMKLVAEHHDEDVPDGVIENIACGLISRAGGEWDARVGGADITYEEDKVMFEMTGPDDKHDEMSLGVTLTQDEYEKIVSNAFDEYRS